MIGARPSSTSAEIIIAFLLLSLLLVSMNFITTSLWCDECLSQISPIFLPGNKLIRKFKKMIAVWVVIQWLSLKTTLAVAAKGYC
jgi:hypothetical protein